MISNEEELEVSGLQVKVRPLKQMTVDEMIELVKSWVMKLQLLSLKQPVHNQASVALKFAKTVQEMYAEQEKLKNKKTTFLERISQKMHHDSELDLQQLVNEIKSLAQENILSKLSEQEAAKRIAIGTSVGKYHKIALQMRGISVKDYLVAKQNFEDLFKTHQLSPASNQTPSVISLQN